MASLMCNDTLGWPFLDFMEVFVAEKEKSCVNTPEWMRCENGNFRLRDVLRRSCYVPIGIAAAEIIDEDIRAADMLVIPEFDSRNLAMADSILQGTWYGDWDGLESAWEWATNLKRRWLEQTIGNG